MLAPAEVVTLVVGLALDLADLHAAGRVHGAVCADAVAFEDDGRPRLRPGVARGGGSAAGDVRDLAALGYLALGDRRPAGLTEALDAPHRDARDLAERVLASGPAAPMRLPEQRREITAREPRESTSPRYRGLVLVGLVVLVVGLCLWPHAHAPERWTNVLAHLDRARDVAVADRSVRELDAIYARGSTSLARDTALIGELVRRGVVLRGRLGALTNPRVLSRSRESATLSVVEQPASYVLVDAQGHVVLRVRGELRRLVLHLRRIAAGWRITTVDLDVRSGMRPR